VKRTWSQDSKEDKLLEIEIQSHIEEIMDNIDCDYATFNVHPLGYNFMRVFIYPAEVKEFNKGDIAKLTSLIQQAFGFVTLPVPKGCSEYSTQEYKWCRDFRENEGRFMLKRQISQTHGDKTYKILFLIENAPKLNCRIESKVIEQTVFEAICE